jgi:hypothetical protein
MTFIPPSEAVRLAGYKGLKPPAATGYLNNFYSSVNPLIRGSESQFTAGILHLVRHHLYTEPTPEALFDCHNNIFGYRAALIGGGQTGHYRATVEAVSQDSEPVDISDPAFASPAHHLVACELQLTAIVVDDNPYPGDAFHINSRNHGTPIWGAGNLSSESLYLGRGTPSDAFGASFDWIVGFFYHHEAMTQEELFLLRQDAEIARDLPIISRVGGTVPDHVWSVKKAMGIGVGTAPPTWTSIGATGGFIFSLTGALDVVDIGTTFGVR